MDNRIKSRFSTGRLAIIAVFAAAAAAVCIQFSDYRFPSTISLSINGPAPNVYNIYLDYGIEGEALDGWKIAVGPGDGFKKVEFDVPDRKVSGAGLGLGHKPGNIILKEVCFRGPFSEKCFGPSELTGIFIPADKAAASGTVGPDGLHLPTSGEMITLRSNDPAFSEALKEVTDARPFMSYALALVSLLLIIVVADTRRLAAYLAFLLGITGYVAAFGLADIALPVFGGLFALSVAELAIDRKRSALMLMGLFMALFMAEMTFMVKERYFTHEPSYTTEESEPYWIAPDPVQGFKPVAGISYTESKKADDEYIYKDVTYTLDEKGRRAVKRMPDAKKHALFFGCSYTLGLGVQDEDTMPSRFQETAGGEYQAYNYAFSGWGPVQAYNALKDDSMFDDVAQPKGIAIYGFVGDHIFRSTPMFTKYYNDFPVFRLDDGGNLEGPFKVYDREELRSWRRLFGSPDGILYKASPGLRYFLKLFPSWPESRADRIRTVEKIIVEMKKLYVSRFDGEFYVLIWDQEMLPDEYVELLVGMLKDDGINVYVLPPVPDPADKHLPFDPHPTPNRHRWAAEHLYDATAGRPASHDDASR